MTIPPVLNDLLTAHGPSGYEATPAAVWRDAAAAFSASVEADVMGSSTARVPATGDGPSLAIVGHIDEIGLIVTHIEESGFLRFTGVGGWDAQVLVGQRVAVATSDGVVPGVVGKKPIHLLDPEQRKKVVKLKEMHIDIGAEDRDAAQALVSVGDPVVIDAEPMAVAGGRLVSRSMDNRLGSYVALEALRRCHDDSKMKARFAAVAAVQEEIGLFGSRTAAFTVRPDLAVAIDVTHATDAPGVDEKEVGSHPFGSGPVIGRGSTLSPRVYELLRDTAEEAGISYSVGASGNATHTDADSLQISRTGIPTGLVSIPLRYMHSPVEMVDLADVEATVELIRAFVNRLEPGVDLSR